MQPYAYPPQPPAYPQYAPPPYAAYAYADRVTLSIGAFPPNVCAKCGRHDGVVRRSENFSWTPPWAYLCYLAGVVVGIIVTVVTTKRGMIHLPICQGCNEKWNKAILWWRLSFLPFFVLLLASFAAAAMMKSGDGSVFGITLLAAFASLIVCPVVVAIVTSHWKMKPTTIDDRFVTLGGVHPQASAAYVAAALPPYPQGYPPPPAGYLPPPHGQYPYAR